MKRILLVGKRGFLGNHLNKYLSKKFQIKFISFKEISSFRKKKIIKYDYIINTSINKNYINKKYHKNYDNDFKISNLLDPQKNTLVFLSSRKIYKSKENIKESSKLNPLSNYSKNKLITENFLKKKFKSNLLILRISNIIGFKKKRKNLHSTFIDMFYEKAKKGLIYDNGKTFKDFLSIQKFSQILEMIIRKDLRGIYNVSIGKKIYLSEIIGWLNRYNKNPIKVIRYKSSKSQNFYLNNKKLMSKIKIKNELSELKKECLILSKKLFN